MLINFTNHPLSQWSEEQKKAASELFGEVVDLPFPSISPEASEEDLLKIAQEFLKKILSYQSKTNNLAVHIMGEFTFTFIMVQLLHQNNIPCYASTTQRIVKEKIENNQTLISATFKFVKFRKYSIIIQ